MATNYAWSFGLKGLAWSLLAWFREVKLGKNVHIMPAGRSNLKVARHLAQQNQSELVIHRPNGQIRDKDSFGKDPMPPKDSKPKPLTDQKRTVV
jgi:hypothetical protein